MKAALDVHYEGDLALAAGVVFEHWADSTPVELVRVVVPVTAPYRAGKFYRRELPCLLALLHEIGCAFETIVIDGYVHLRPEVGLGLGAHLHRALAYCPAIVGVAKNPLRVAVDCVPLWRGRSARPLYISAIGLPLAQAARAVAAMHGPGRIPTLLRLADRHARMEVPGRV